MGDGQTLEEMLEKCGSCDVVEAPFVPRGTHVALIELVFSACGPVLQTAFNSASHAARSTGPFVPLDGSWLD